MRLSGNPKHFELSRDLDKKRGEIFNVQHKFNMRRNDLLAQIERANRATIAEFNSWIDMTSRALSAARTVEFEDSDYVENKTVRTNSQAVGAARDRLMAMRAAVRDLALRSNTADLRKRIGEFKREAENFDLRRIESAEVSAGLAGDLKDAKEPGHPASGWMLSDGGIIAAGGRADDKTEAKQLGHAIERLKSKIQGDV
jgi:hypothetical protein